MKTLIGFAFMIAAAELFAGCSGSSRVATLPDNGNAAVRRASGGQESFTYTGAEQTFTVPHGVTSIKVVADGAAGDAYESKKFAKGGRTQATVAVTPGETLYVFVGGQGAATTGGFNGGAIGCPSSDGRSWGGGGASDIRQGGDDLGSRIVVAGGGGGQGFDKLHGGPGGGLTGGTGKGPPPGHQRGQGGGGGTQTQGGAGGAGGFGDGRPGSPGTLGAGGSGGSGNEYYGNDCGGGGGGGYYGGGGGGTGSYSSGSLGGGSGGGGGGGSSYAESSAKDVQLLQGWKTDTGNGVIAFSW